MQQIWTFKFLEVVWQHMLGFMGIVIYCFVANLTDFPAVKEFEKSVKVWQNYRHNRVAHFLRHNVVVIVAAAASVLCVCGWATMQLWNMLSASLNLLDNCYML